MKKSSNQNEKTKNLDRDFFNETHVARYAGLIEVRAEILSQ